MGDVRRQLEWVGSSGATAATHTPPPASPRRVAAFRARRGRARGRGRRARDVRSRAWRRDTRAVPHALTAAAGRRDLHPVRHRRHTPLRALARRPAHRLRCLADRPSTVGVDPFAGLDRRSGAAWNRRCVQPVLVAGWGERGLRRAGQAEENRARRWAAGRRGEHPGRAGRGRRLEQDRRHPLPSRFRATQPHSRERWPRGDRDTGIQGRPRFSNTVGRSSCPMAGTSSIQTVKREPRISAIWIPTK